MKVKRILMSASALAVVATLTACGEKEKSTVSATIWVSESAGVAELTQQQVQKFNSSQDEYEITATIEGISEANSASQMLTDVESGADIYCFAQDQMNRLVTAGALSKLGVSATNTVKDSNDNGSVSAASVNGELYCYPMTADNGYFMMYNKEVLDGVDLNSLEAIVAKCEEKGYNFSMEVSSSSWYTASFFFATGCSSTWTTNSDGTFASVNDDWNSANGLIAMRGMQHLVKSSCYVASSAASDFAAATPSAVVVTGTWGASTAKDALGEKFACAKLPSFTVDGKSYQLGSYSGYKLMGVKPQTDATKQAALHKLAQYLTNESCQLERFNQFGWGPSNLQAQQSDAIKADVALSALAQQNVYSTPQGQIHGSWWDIAKVLGEAAKAAAKDDTTALQTALTTYKEAVDALFSMSDAEKRAFTVIGSLNNTSWGTDFEMVETETNSNIWVSTDTFTITDADITAGLNEFKCRQGKSWDVSYGKDGGSDNYKITTAGKYKIKLTVTDAGATIELVPVTE